MCLIGIHLQSPVLQQAGAFLLGRHHRHIKGQRPDPPLHQRSAQRLGQINSAFMEINDGQMKGTGRFTRW